MSSSSMSKRSRSSTSRSSTSTSEKREAPSREFQLVASLFGSERAALIPEVDHPKVVRRVQQLFGSLSSDQKPVVNCRFNLFGELAGGPMNNHSEIAAELDRPAKQVGWSLTSAERTLREGLERTFPVLKSPVRTPQNS